MLADSDGETLLGAVYERPWDDAARLVYADWLAERGDPRGEFIVLQSERARGPATLAQQRREKQLYDAHWRRWSGPLGPMLRKQEVRFERGFLSTCCWRPTSRVRLAAVIGHPVWSTVEELVFRGGTGGGRSDEMGPHPAVRLVADPAMRALRSVEGIGSDEMAALCTTTRKLRLESACFFGHQPLDDNALGLLSSAPSLPSLRTLGYVPLNPYATTPAALRWVMKAPLARRIERLIVGEQSPLASWLAEMDLFGGALPVLEVRRGWQMEVGPHHGWKHAITRDRAGHPSVVRASYVPRKETASAGVIEELVGELERLPAEALTALEVDAGRPLEGGERAAIDRAALRFLRLDRLALG